MIMMNLLFIPYWYLSQKSGESPAFASNYYKTVKNLWATCMDFSACLYLAS